MTWRDLKVGDKVAYTVVDYDGSADYIGVVAEKHDDYAIIDSDLVITPEDKRKYDIHSWIDDDLAVVFDNLRKIA